jgi:PAS domain S-box-containing protein
MQGHETIRILHLEDNRNDHILILETLRVAGLHCTVEWATNRVEFETALQGGAFNLIIGDFGLPAYDGATALLAANRSQPDVPFIFVSATIGEERAVESLQNGATDYVLKQRLERLVPAVVRALREAKNRQRRRQAEEAMRQSDERFRAMAENIREVFWSSSPDGGAPFYVSPAYEHIWKRPLAEINARPASWLEAVVPDDQARVRAARDGLRRGLPYSIEYRIAWPDRTLRWIEDRGYPVANAGAARTARVVGVALDITDRKLLEEQLHQSRKMEAIGLLAGGIAHDFNNMLTVINGRARLLLDTDNFVPDVTDSIRQIYIAGERAARLTRQLLVFSRKQFMQSQPVDLNVLTEEVVRMLRPIIGEQISLELDLKARTPVVLGDASMLEQVVMNLAVNSRDAMPRGGRLLISTEIRNITPADCLRNPEAVCGPYVCLQVHDTGCGIAPEILPRIFEPFFTTKAAGKGTGLGLSTVFGIIKHQGGWIEVRSKAGFGTTFTTFLPLSSENAIAAEAVPAVANVLGGNETILLVEDESIVREFASAVLRSYGYRVLQAGSGPEALELWPWHSAKIALLLTDLVMPDEVSGIELAKRLREEKPELKVIYASGYSPESSAPGFSALKGLNFLHKPYAPKTLAQMVREVLDQGTKAKLAAAAVP